MKLYWAAPAQLNEYQPQIRRIGERVNDPELFERIMEELYQTRAFLFKPKTDPCCIVLRPVQGPGVLIWVAVSAGRCDWRRYALEIDLLARKIGAEFSECLSVRAGFAKKMPPLGYKPAPTQWNGVDVTRWRKDYV